MDNSMVFNIFIKRDGDTFVAHCLELDIVAESDTQTGVMDDIRELIITQIDFAFSNNNLDNLYRSAPTEVWKQFYECPERTTSEILRIGSRSSQENGPKVFVPSEVITNTCTVV